MREPKSVADLLTYRVLRLSNTFGLYASRRYRDQIGITLPEWRVMSIVASWEPTTAREVSRVLATDKAWVGLSMERLRRRGYVQRATDAKDARRMLVTLTARGRQVHDAILAIARRRQRRLLSVLPAGAARTLIDSLDLLQAEADRMLAELDAQDRAAPVPKVTRTRTSSRAGTIAGAATAGTGIAGARTQRKPSRSIA